MYIDALSYPIVMFHRKRAAAKQLIEAYYIQLTDGCGSECCTNANCASSPDFVFKDKDRNVLAVASIDLFKKKAQLCATERNKVARNDLPSPMATGPPNNSVTTDGPVAAPLPGPSTSKPQGVMPKSRVSQSTGDTLYAFCLFTPHVRHKSGCI